jgi:hypothetical protein
MSAWHCSPLRLSIVHAVCPLCLFSTWTTARLGEPQAVEKRASRQERGPRTASYLSSGPMATDAESDDSREPIPGTLSVLKFRGTRRGSSTPWKRTGQAGEPGRSCQPRSR